VFQEVGHSSPGKFSRWLRRPLRLLDDRPPLALLDSPTGIQLIDDLLGRIEYGVFS
jgi:putative toxin-antitoxin system antitoxin component (TIGR02293 family)